MAENKIIQQQIPAYTYSVPPMPIGEGYAAGITSAGKSIAGAISGIMGGIDSAGNVTHGILEQNQTVNDMLSYMHQTGGISDDAFSAAMSKGLGARNQIVGAYFGQMQTTMKEQLEQQNRLAQIQAQGDQAMRERAAAEEAATQRQQQELELKRQEMLLQNRNQGPLKFTQQQ